MLVNGTVDCGLKVSWFSSFLNNRSSCFPWSMPGCVDHLQPLELVCFQFWLPGYKWEWCAISSKFPSRERGMLPVSVSSLSAGPWTWWLKLSGWYYVQKRAEPRDGIRLGSNYVELCRFLQKFLWLEGHRAEIQSRPCFPSCGPGERLNFYLTT